VATTIDSIVNAEARTLHVVGRDMPLLYALRNDLGLRGPHFGCGLGQCESCTVLFNGSPLRSCVMPTSAAAGAKIVALEGLGTPEKPHQLQQAFVDEPAAQSRAQDSHHIGMLPCVRTCVKTAANIIQG
jgi:nicotinate dehydrogenase subunit A